jgi:uncharacterized protein
LNKLKVIVLCTILVVLVFHIVLAVYIYRKLFFRKKKSIEHELKSLIRNDLISENYYEELKLNKITINSRDNYKLAGYIVKCKKPIGCVILSHGISCNHATMLWNVELLKRNNYDVLLIDQRGYGNSSITSTTYGLKETNDIVLWMKYLKNLKYNKVGILGHSMGASIALLTCKEDCKPDFIIAESAFSNLKELVKFQISAKQLPPTVLLFIVNVICKLINGFKLSDIDVLRAVKDTNIPILFIHGRKDSVIPFYMSKDMAEVSKSEMFYIDNCDHYIHEDISPYLCEYENIISNFLSHQDL